MFINFWHSLVKKTPTTNAIIEMQKKTPNPEISPFFSPALCKLCVTAGSLWSELDSGFSSPQIFALNAGCLWLEHHCATCETTLKQNGICFTLQEKELHSKPSPSICAATLTSLTVPVFEIHGDKLYLLLLLLLHGLKETKLLKGITTVRKICIKSHH